MRWAPAPNVSFGLALVLLLQLLGWVAAIEQDEEIRLEVTIRNRDMLDQAPSCLHTFSRVELVNQHNSEIIIKSIDISRERTVRVNRDGSDREGAVAYDALSQQVHVSRVTNNFVALEPGQGAIVPLTFLPRFPPPQSEGETLVALPMDLTCWQQADRERWLGSVATRNNLGLDDDDDGDDDEPEMYKVSTTLLVETNYGIAKVPFDVKSLRENAYALPDTIFFAKEASPNLSQDADDSHDSFLAGNGIRIVSTYSNPHTFESTGPDPDCYDLYLTHPGEAVSSIDVQVHEILVSRPQNVSVQVMPDKDPSLNLLESGPRHAVREWTNEGPLLIPPDNAQHYVATICRNDTLNIARDAEADRHVQEKAYWIDPENIDGSLGFVQIRTDTETVFVSLAEDDMGMDRMTKMRYFADRRPELGTSLGADDRNLTSLNSFPDQIEVVVVDGSQDSVAIEVGLNNTADVDVTIIRTSLAFGSIDERELSDLDIKVQITPSTLDARNWRIKAGEQMDGALSFNVSWGHNYVSDRTVDIEGRVIVQGSTIYESPDRWHQELRADTRLDSNVTAEIPVIIRLVQGRISLALSGSTLPFMDLFALEAGPRSLDTLGACFFPNDFSDFLTLADGSRDDILNFKSIDHHVRAYSTTNSTLTLATAQIFDEQGNLANRTGGSLCSRFRATSTEHLGVILDEGISDLGLIYLKYEFPHSGYLTRNVQTDNAMPIHPTKCSLRFTTYPESGTHSLPLVVYPGLVEVSVGALEEKIQTVVPSRPPFGHNRVNSVIGFPQMLDWFQNSKAGSSLRSLLSSKRAENDDVLLARYMYGLAKTSINLESSTLRPVLLKVGAVNPDETEVLPIFITNHNPVAAKIRIDVPEVEGITMALGRDPVHGHAHSLLEQTNTRATYWKHGTRMAEAGPFKGQPIAAFDQFLRSNPTAQSIISFGFRDAIKMSDEAVHRTPLLRDLYRSKSNVEYHKRKTDEHPMNHSTRCGELEGSQSYSSFMSNLRGRKYPGPVTISPESKSVRALRQCTNNTGKLQSVSPEISVPPGATARFDVTLRSPPLSVLDHDINQFLSTGLVLSTGHGEVLPIFVAFETPRGKLDVSPMLGADGYETVSNQGDRSVRVTSGLFGKQTPRPDTIVIIPPKSRSFDGVVSGDIMTVNPSGRDKGASLYMKSSFNRPVELLEVSSCNPWFEVALHNGSTPPAIDPLLGVNIGNIKSIVSCDYSADVNKTKVDYPSFFSCALNWVLQQPELQPQGCGYFSGFDQKGRNTQSSERSQALIALNRAVTLSQWSLGQNRAGRKRRAADGYVAPALLDAIANAWYIWQKAPNSSLLRLSTSLRAEIRYNSTQPELAGHHDSGVHHLSLAMGNLTIDSVLEVPSLGNDENGNADHGPIAIEFPRTLVGDVSSRMIPVSNPTAVPIRVRLAVSPGNERLGAYRGNDQLKTSSWARQEYLGRHDAPYTQSGNNAQSSVEFVSEQWWDGGGSFFIPDAFGALVRSHYNITVRAGSGALVSLLTPGLLSNVAFIAGCGLRCGVKDEMPNFEGPHDVRATSFIGAAAAEQAVLMGQQQSSQGEAGRTTFGKGMFFEAGGSMLTGGKGPSPFSIPFFSMNKEIEIPPFGSAELGPVWFRPPGPTKYMGCESRNGAALPQHCNDDKFASMLFVENSLTGLERVVVRGRGKLKRVVFHDNAGDGFSDIEMRNGRDALIFSGSAKPNVYGPGESKQFFLSNEGDVDVAFAPPFLVDTAALKKSSMHGETRSCSLGEFSFVPCSKSNAPIELAPGENITFFVQHEPRCVQSSMFVAMVFEYYQGDTGSQRNDHPRKKRSPFQKSQEELLLGYRMDAIEKSRCVPSGGHVVLSFLDVLDSLGLKRPEQNIFEGSGMLAIVGFALTYTLIILFLSASGLFLLRKLYSRQAKSSAFQTRLLGGATEKERSNWLATLRCLSRLDPSSQDLQTLGREQTRQVLLNQFRIHGVLPPLCLNASGLFQRERSMGVVRSRSQMSSSGGADRIRTLSDAIFKQTKPCFSAQGALTSYGAGWKLAHARGILSDVSLQGFGFELSTEKLLLLRRQNVILSERKGGVKASKEKNEKQVRFSSGEFDGDRNRKETEASSEEPSDVEEEEDDSVDDEERDESAVDESPRVGKVVVPEIKPVKTKDDAHVPENESSEFMKVTAKGKPSRKNTKIKKSVSAASRKKAGAKDSGAEAGGSRTRSEPLASKLQDTRQENIKSAPKRSKQNRGKATNGDSVESGEDAHTSSSSHGQKAMSKKTGKGTRGNMAQTQNSLNAPFTTPDEPKPVSQSPLRPPPGLAPPPGFESSVVSPSSKPTPPPIEIPPQPQSVLPSVMPPSSPQIYSGLLPESDGTGVQSENTEPVAATPASIDIGANALLTPGGTASELNLAQPETSEDGFDIMDFLDGILNEGGTPAPATTPHVSNQESTDISSPSLLLAPSSNPWAETAATEEPRSRATNYGINFDVSEGDTNDREAPMSVDIPMLTPEAILGTPTVGGDPDEDDVGEDKDKAYSDFYTSLLK